MSMRARIRASRSVPPISIELRRLLTAAAWNRRCAALRGRRVVPATAIDLAQEVEHQPVVLPRALEVDGVGGALDDRQACARDQLRELTGLPRGDEQVLLGADHVHGQAQAAQPVARLVRGAGSELAQVALAALAVRIGEHELAKVLELAGHVL